MSTLDPDTPLYGLHGGSSYRLPYHPGAFPGGESSWFATLEEAWQEWTRRRNDWSGRFPCWGDGGPDDDAVYLSDPCTTYETWTARDLAGEDLFHYYDETDWSDSDDETDET